MDGYYLLAIVILLYTLRDIWIYFHKEPNDYDKGYQAAITKLFKTWNGASQENRADVIANFICDNSNGRYIRRK